VLVGPESGDDAGVYLHDGRALVATVDFIPPVCDEPRRFGRVAAANSLSDVWAMGGEPLFVLNVCSLPSELLDGVGAEIFAGAAAIVAAAGAIVLGGHTVSDAETKFGLAAIGIADPDRLLTLGGAQPGQHLVLTKPLGTGVLINAFKFDRLDADGLEPALVEMERTNQQAARAALAHGATAATDVTGFGLAGHAANIARESALTLEIRFADLAVHPGFYDLVRAGVSTGCTPKNRRHVEAAVEFPESLSAEQQELLFDPQTSGGLLICLPAEHADGLVDELVSSGHSAAVIGEVLEGDRRLRFI
jgi:selenide,water dikinase